MPMNKCRSVGVLIAVPALLVTSDSTVVVLSTKHVITNRVDIKDPSPKTVKELVNFLDARDPATQMQKLAAMLFTKPKLAAAARLVLRMRKQKRVAAESRRRYLAIKKKIDGVGHRALACAAEMQAAAVRRDVEAGKTRRIWKLLAAPADAGEIPITWAAPSAPAAAGIGASSSSEISSGASTRGCGDDPENVGSSVSSCGGGEGPENLVDGCGGSDDPENLSADLSGLWDSSDNGSGGSDVETQMYVGDGEQRSVTLAELHADV